MLRNIHRSNSNEIYYMPSPRSFHLQRSVHGFYPGILNNKFHYFIKYFLISFERIRGGAYFDAGSLLAVVSENFMRISRLLRHVFGFGAYSRTPFPDI